MTKKITSLIIALIFTAGITGMAAAASITCNVETVENGKVILNCGDKAEKLEAGTEVKVKTVVSRKAVEGC